MKVNRKSSNLRKSVIWFSNRKTFDIGLQLDIHDHMSSRFGSNWVE
ncbi:hypothetical protein TRICHSKD4_2630 [Roseibium sp. TrichSKD4]|nr:hypothetical protein TRICHSKD4_2630 [Roseibium sp. TrichSKD4]